MAGARVERLFVVVNTRAGGVRRRPGLVSELRAAVGSRGEVVTTTQPAELTAALARARLGGADAIGICGGDGSNVHALTAIGHAWRGVPWPRIVMLPAGTLNTAAGNLGLRGDPPAQVRALLAREEPDSTARPLVSVNHLTGFIFGAQMVARVLDAYYAGRTGPLGAAWLTAHLVGSSMVGGPFSQRMLEKNPIEVSIEDGPFTSYEVSALLASTVASPSMGLRAMPRAGEDGCFQLIATQQPPTAIAREIGRIVAGLPLKCMDLDAVAKKATLRLGEDARWTVDGDLFQGSEVRLEATAPVEILVP